jgi:hypothetical protein
MLSPPVSGQHAGQQSVGVRERQYQRDVEHEGEDEVPAGEQRERKKDARRQHKGGMRRDEVEDERGALGTARTSPVACRAKSFGVVFVGVWPVSMSSVPH